MAEALELDGVERVESLRAGVIDGLRRELMGPLDPDIPLDPLFEPPHKRYITGILYPQEADKVSGDGPELSAVDGGATSSGPGAVDDSPIASVVQRRPASAGITFAVSKGARVEITVRASRYAKASQHLGADGLPIGGFAEVAGGNPRDAALLGKVEADHSELSGNGEAEGDEGPAFPPEIIVHTGSWYRTERLEHVVVLQGRGERLSLWGEHADLQVVWRKRDGLDLLTATIINNRVSGKVINGSDCLAQVELEVVAVKGSFVHPPTTRLGEDEEDQELRLRYRNKVAWAVGHSTSVDWEGGEGGEGGPPSRLRMEFIPTADIHPFTREAPAEAEFEREVLRPGWLVTAEPAEIRLGLEGFVAAFGEWVESQESEEGVPAQLGAAAARIRGALRDQLNRMRLGIEFLLDPLCPHRLQAFQTANEAMLRQMEQTQVKAGKGASFERAKVRWYPFQLAFQLLAIPGVDPRDDIEVDGNASRNLVDLIWFPTGGGKTEAYLLLAAYAIALRRRVLGDTGGGTAVISRYTLRLLTAQQFERTSTLVCALELMRRDGLVAGHEPISIGLWIGGGENSSPNSIREARIQLTELLEEKYPRNRFMVERCPWCGAKIIPNKITPNRNLYGIQIVSEELRLSCVEGSCAFHSGLPVQVVDECMYAKPPTILLGTIDKFARLPWLGVARSMFGFRGEGADNVAPPMLVIQDELHLISGPLGTIAAIYEAGIEALMTRNGRGPKVIAATATIRGSGDQVERLYGHPVRVFPAGGLDVEDSWFMRIDRSGRITPRRYVGVMGQGHDPVTNLVRTLAIQLQAAAGGSERDDEYWTVAAYHNSRRELGKTLTIARDDVPARIRTISGDREARTVHGVSELSGQLPTWRVPQVLEEVYRTRGDDDCLDVLACTSMISVGVDIERLHSMLINGQPKTCSEYIQASSRVGRGPLGGGLVVVVHSPSKPRDRSHHEMFRAFHEAIYRWVEPTSVTPHAGPALDRALHAAFITAVRLDALPGGQEAAEVLNAEPRTLAAIETFTGCLLRRVRPEDRALVERRLDEFRLTWECAADENSYLPYESIPQIDGLMTAAEPGLTYGMPFPTLNSMRNVDGDIPTLVRKRSKDVPS